MAGVPFLRNSPAFTAAFPSAILLVEWAIGADLAAAPGTWTWSEINNDVMVAGGGGINISPMGRSDAVGQTQPAQCSFRLKNTSGAYSKGPQSSNYPNIKLNIPVRVRIALDGVAANGVIRFQGYIYQLKPSWDETGNYAVVDVQAAGASRRMLQGEPPDRSPLYRDIIANTAGDLIAYWPMEDPPGSTTLYSAVPTGRPMRWFNNISLQANTELAGAKAIPVFSATTGISANIPKGLGNTQFQFDWHAKPGTVPVTDGLLMTADFTGGSAVRWEMTIVAGSSTQYKVTAIDSTGATLGTLTSTPPVVGGLVNNVMLHFTMTGRQNGGNVDVLFSVFPPLGGTGSFVTFSYAGTLGIPFQARVTPSANGANMAIGHLTVYNCYALNKQGQAEDAWISEDAGARLTRLATEDNLTIVQSGTSDTPMGYQPVASILPVLRDIEQADLGTLGDGLGPGFYFVSRLARYNQATMLTLDVATNQVAPPFEPIDDDDKITNRVQASRTLGSNAVFADLTGALGVNAIGAYNDSATVNIAYDDDLLNYAGWLVHLGTSEGYRYPQVSMILNRIPTKAAAWLSVTPGERIDVTNPTSWASQHPTGTIGLLVEGWAERITNQQWTATLNCSPANIWNVGTLGAATGAVVDPVARLDVTPGTCTVNTSAILGATSLSVATTSAGALWTTKTADFPLTISVGGRAVTVSAISGASSPQAFTVSALPAAAPAGTAVGMYQPSVYAL